MKIIPKPEFKSAHKLTAAEMNRIHFGGNHSVVVDSKKTDSHSNKG